LLEYAGAAAASGLCLGSGGDVMTTDRASRLEAVIVRDGDGSVYAVPRRALTRWRLPDQVAASFGEPEVTGYLSVGGLQVLGSAQGVVHTDELLRVSLAFQKITVEWNPGNQTAVDDWQA
jgi:hypothetical protein